MRTKSMYDVDICLKPESAYSDYLNSQAERTDALAQIHELKRHLQAAGSLSERAAALIQDAQAALRKQQSALEGFLNCIPLSQRRPVGVQALIEKVFSTVELLENILWFLDLHDALAAQQVNKSFFHAIEDSPRIQRRLGFLADVDSHLRITIPLTTPSIYFFIDDLNEDFRLISDNGVTLTGDIFNGVKKLPKLGNRTRRLLVCQPPIHKLSIFADCCFDRYATLPSMNLPRTRVPTYLIESSSGVTLGDVIENAKRIAKEHRTCASAPVVMHDDQGYVKCSLFLSANIPLKDGDPRLLKKQHRQKEEEARADRHRGMAARLPPYIAAKQAALRTGLPIPTLEEFELQRNSEQDS